MATFVNTAIEYQFFFIVLYNLSSYISALWRFLSDMVQTSMQKMIQAKRRKCILRKKKDKKSNDIKDTELNNIKKKSPEERSDTIALHSYAL